MITNKKLNLEEPHLFLNQPSYLFKLIKTTQHINNHKFHSELNILNEIEDLLINHTPFNQNIVDSNGNNIYHIIAKHEKTTLFDMILNAKIDLLIQPNKEQEIPAISLLNLKVKSSFPYAEHKDCNIKLQTAINQYLTNLHENKSYIDLENFYNSLKIHTDHQHIEQHFKLITYNYLKKQSTNKNTQHIKRSLKSKI